MHQRFKQGRKKYVLGQKQKDQIDIQLLLSMIYTINLHKVIRNDIIGEVTFSLRFS